MTLDNIKKIRALRVIIPINIICDNSMTFTDGNKGTVVLWDDDSGIVTCIRSNPKANQDKVPFEITIVEYDIIQFMRVDVNKDTLSDYINTLGLSNGADVIKYLLEQDYASASICSGTGDGIAWK